MTEIRDTDLPLLSIITPSFNQGKYLENAILSVLSQTYPKIEYIIIDGGSVDDSPEIIKKYKDRLAYWCSEADKGQADAINKGFEKAKGEYICWLNSDDILYPDFIKRRIDDFTRFPEADMIYGDVEQGKDENEKIIRKGKQSNFKEMLISGNVPIPQQSAIWKKSIIKKAGNLNVNWKVLLDRDFFMRIAFYGKIHYSEGVTGFFLNHELSKSVSLSMDWVKELPIYYNELFSSFLPFEYKKYERVSKANMHAGCTKICISNKKFIPGIKHTFNAILLNPFIGIGVIPKIIKLLLLSQRHLIPDQNQKIL